MKNQNALIIFFKVPYSCYVKTRLAQTIGPKAANQIHKLLVEYVIQNVYSSSYHIYLFFTPAHQLKTVKEYLPGFSYFPQFGNNLGQKIQNAFKTLFNNGYQKVIIIGTDTPDLNEKMIQESFLQLDNCNYVIGPAYDGGFYLFGLQHTHKNDLKKMLNQIAWGTDRVFSQLTSSLKHTDYYKLITLSDIDTYEDLKKSSFLKKIPQPNHLDPKFFSIFRNYLFLPWICCFFN